MLCQMLFFLVPLLCSPSGNVPSFPMDQLVAMVSWNLEISQLNERFGAVLCRNICTGKCVCAYKSFIYTRGIHAYVCAYLYKIVCL